MNITDRESENLIVVVSSHTFSRFFWLFGKWRCDLLDLGSSIRVNRFLPLQKPDIVNVQTTEMGRMEITIPLPIQRKKFNTILG